MQHDPGNEERDTFAARNGTAVGTIPRCGYVALGLLRADRSPNQIVVSDVHVSTDDGPFQPPLHAPPSFSERAERLQLPSNRPPWHAEWPEWQLAACKTLRLPITFELRTFPLPTPSHATPRRQPPPRAPLHPLLTHHLRTNLTTLSDLSSPLFFAVEPSVCSACSLQVRLPDFGLLRLAFLHACPSSSSPTHRFLAPYPTPPTTH